jgi:integrase
MSDVLKRCACDESKHNRCLHPWYMKKFLWQGRPYAPNVTRWARVTLHEDVTTRTRADVLVEQIRTQIRAGTFTSAKAANTARPVADAEMTFTQLIAAFDRDVLSVRIGDTDDASAETVDTHRRRLARLAAFEACGTRHARAVDYALLKRFRTSAAMQQQGRSSWGKYWGIYGRLFRYAKHAGIVPVNPCARDVLSEAEYNVVRRRKPEPRTRRLRPGEEERLLRAARVGRFPFDAQRLSDLIVAALECAARYGELLALQWRDLELVESGVGIITIRGDEDGASKTGARVVPMSDRFKAMALRRRVHPLTGQPFPEHAYVFGNEVGERIRQIRSWEPCVVRAAGHEPTLVRGNLSAASRAIYRAAKLHFHDLRREAASRWLESRRFDVKQISKLLGHSNLATTDIYLDITEGSTLDAMRAYNADRAADAQLPVAIGLNDYNASTNAGDPGSTGTGPRLVKGHKRRGDSTLRK